MWGGREGGSVCCRVLGFYFVLCIVDLEPCLLSCPGSSVGRALCLESRVSGFESHPGQLLFPLKKVLSWFVGYALALHPLIHAL